jgi:hypothetical protein
MSDTKPKKVSSIAAALESLESMRDNSDWRGAARTLAFLERMSLMGPGQLPWVKVCSERSGYSPNNLRRFQAVASFFDYCVSKFGVTEPELEEIPFSRLELIARIHAVDAELAARLVRRRPGDIEILPQSTPGLHALLNDLRRLGKAASPSAAGISSRVLIHGKIVALLGAEVLGFDIGKARRPSRFSVICPDLVCATSGSADDKQKRAFVAIEIIDATRSKRESILQRDIINSTASATFFDAYWLAVFGEHANDMAEFLSKMGGTDNIGVIEIDENVTRVLKITAPRGRPFPDRTRMWYDMTPDFFLDRLEDNANKDDENSATETARQTQP